MWGRRRVDGCWAVLGLMLVAAACADNPAATPGTGGSSGSGGTVSGSGGAMAAGSGGADNPGDSGTTGSGGTSGGAGGSTSDAAVTALDAPLDSPPSDAGPVPPEPSNFTCTLILGAFQTSQWYDAGFEAAVGTARWEIKSAHNNWTEKWADPKHAIWNLPTVSPCASNATTPDRVILIVYKDMFSPPIDPAVWKPEISKSAANIKAKYPSAKQIELITLARAPNNQPCPGNTSRNIVIAPEIEAAMQAVADESGGLVKVGPKYYVPDCSMFLMNITTLTDAGAKAVAPMMIDYYKAHP